MLLLLLPLPRVYVCFGFLLMLALSMDARADAVLLRFRPPTNGVVAGYKVYAAFETTGAITSAPIDAGARSPDSTGVASYSLANLDPARSYSVEMTAYDSGGVESARSNRITLAPRVQPSVETLGTPLWQSDFSLFAPGVHAPGFVDLVGDTRTTTTSDIFKVSYFGNTNAAFGTAVQPGAVASRYIGSASNNWGSYEIAGRVWANTTTGQLGIAARSTGDNTRYFALGQNTSGGWLLRAWSEPALTCGSGPATGVTQPAFRWYRFKLRTTRASSLTRVRAKVWSDGAAEPSAWQADCWTTLAASADSGSFSLMRGGSGMAYWDDLSVRPVQGTLDRIPGP